MTRSEPLSDCHHFHHSRHSRASGNPREIECLRKGRFECNDKTPSLDRSPVRRRMGSVLAGATLRCAAGAVRAISARVDSEAVGGRVWAGCGGATSDTARPRSADGCRPSARWSISPRWPAASIPARTVEGAVAGARALGVHPEHDQPREAPESERWLRPSTRDESLHSSGGPRRWIPLVISSFGRNTVGT